jgi:hypothetical protein
MRKIADIIENILAVAGAALMVWLLLSWLNVLIARPAVSAWNIFNFL